MAGESEGLLSPYRILDLTDEKGAVCGRILADFGADVIKVERPGGDPSRHIGPFYHDIADPEKSLFWFAYNANKRGITLDLDRRDGREMFKRLAETADAVVESFPPGYMDGLGLGYGDLAQVNPGIIMTSISPFGQTGPYRDFKGPDLVTWSMGGMTGISGDPDRPPLRVSCPQSYPQAGAAAAVGTVFALFHRGATGEGQHVDVSTQEQIANSLMNVRVFWEMCGINLRRAGQFRTGLSTAANQRVIWPCKDGYVNYPIMGGKTGARSNQALTDWLKGEGMADEYLCNIDWLAYDMAQATAEQFARMEAPIGEFFKVHTKEELFVGAVERGVMLYPVYSAKEIFEDVQLKHRQFWQPLEHPELDDEIVYPGTCVQLSEAQCGLRRRAPLIGEHNEEILGELGLSGDDIPRLPAQGNPTGTDIFQGIKILDLSWVIAGPSAVKYLADHGATVIRVESTNHPDTIRVTPPFRDRIPGLNRSAYYAIYNNNKYGMALNLQHPKGREIAKKLALWADVVVESFSPGTMARWGLAYEDLSPLKPDLIMYSTSQQGQTGPHATIAAFGTSLVSLAGFTHLGAWPDRGPVGPYAGYTDMAARPVGAVALAAALDYRRRTGRGVYIDLSQYETAASFLAPSLLDYTVNRRVQGPQGNRCPDAAPHGVFPCRGFDRWCAIAVVAEEEWLALRQAMGNPEWAARPEFASLQLRKRNEDELEGRLADWTANYTAEGLMHRLQNSGVPAGVVQTGEDVQNDPQLAHRRFLVELEHQEIGKHWYEAPPFKLSKTPAELNKAAPCLGEDTDYVCTNILGMSDEEFVALMAEGVLQ